MIVSALNPLKIFSGGAMRPLLRELAPRFERAYGVTVEIEFQLSSALKRAIQDGAFFNLAILPRPELDELIACGAIVRDSVVNVARSTVGLAVRAGAPKPDIGNVDAVRRTAASALDRLQRRAQGCLWRRTVGKARDRRSRSGQSQAYQRSASRAGRARRGR